MSRTTNKRPGKAKSGLSRKQKVAIYIRVSTLYQVDRDSLPMQRKDLIAYASLILGIEEYELFEDAGYSGKNTDRPAFQEMMQRIRKGEFTHVLVWKIDRISRNLLDFAEMYEELQDLRVTKQDPLSSGLLPLSGSLSPVRSMPVYIATTDIKELSGVSKIRRTNGL